MAESLVHRATLVEDARPIGSFLDTATGRSPWNSECVSCLRAECLRTAPGFRVDGRPRMSTKLLAAKDARILSSSSLRKNKESVSGTGPRLRREGVRGPSTRAEA